MRNLKSIKFRNVARFLVRQGFKSRMAKGSHRMFSNGKTSFMFRNGREVDSAAFKELAGFFGEEKIMMEVV